MPDARFPRISAPTTAVLVQRLLLHSSTPQIIIRIFHYSFGYQRPTRPCVGMAVRIIPPHRDIASGGVGTLVIQPTQLTHV